MISNMYRFNGTVDILYAVFKSSPFHKGGVGGFDSSVIARSPFDRLRATKQSSCFAAGLGLRVSGLGTKREIQGVIARSDSR